jgi:hypothetical protein
MNDFLNNLWPTDPPNTCRDILPLATMAINLKRVTTDSFCPLKSLSVSPQPCAPALSSTDRDETPMLQSLQPSPL